MAINAAEHNGKGVYAGFGNSPVSQTTKNDDDEMISRKRTKLAVIAIFTIIASSTVVLINQNVSAHANLAESSPHPSEELDSPPERVIIWFTEPIEPAFSAISVRDGSGAEVTDGATEFEPTEPTAMWVKIGEIENGIYTVAWRNVSSVDGHKVTGSFLFAVGEPLGTGSVAAEQQPILRSPFEPIVRWFIYIGIAVFAGGLIFELLIVDRLARTEDQDNVFAFVTLVGGRFVTVAIAAIVVVVVAQVAQLILQTAIAYDDWFAALNAGRIVEVVTQSDWGRFWSWRFTTAILAVVTLIGVRQSIRHAQISLDDDETALVTETPWGIGAIALGGIYLLLIALTSHNAATPNDIRWFAIATDLIHIISATVWVGGVAYLTVASVHAIRSGEQHARTMVRRIASRFAPLAIFATSILVASGIVSSLMQVTIPEALNTPYGRVLGIKVLLLVVLIALAIRNNRSVASAGEPDATHTRSLSRYVSIELGVAFSVLLATAGLASLEPARQYAERTGIAGAEYVSHSETIAGADINVKLDPGETGTNSLMVDLMDGNGDPFVHADEVRARIKYLDDDFGEYFVPLENPSTGEWHLDDITIGISGAYQLDITVVRSDAFDSHVSTRFSATSRTFASDLIRPSPRAAMAAFGGLIAIIGIAYFAVMTASQRPIRFGFSAGHGIATLVAVIGVVVVINASVVGIGLPAESDGNPFPLTQDSVDMGLATYATTCATCHGDTGKGDGPAGLALNPPPADLAIHVPLHTDNELYSFIADGIEGTSMVAQLGNLTSEEIWHLVNYIRTISD